MDPTTHNRSVTSSLEQFMSEICILCRDQHNYQTFVVCCWAFSHTSEEEEGLCCHAFLSTLSQDSSETGLLLTNLSEPQNLVLG